VLTLSAFNHELSILKFLKNGADGYIVKGSNPDELQRAILHILAGGIYFPTELFTTIPTITAAEKIANVPALSPKEYTFLSHCSTDLTYKEIASKMNQSLRTIEGYRDSLFKKLQVNSRTGLAVLSIESGISYLYKTA
jgi:DNA-binding NarL/FixJ family response regulator